MPAHTILTEPAFIAHLREAERLVGLLRERRPELFERDIKPWVAKNREHMKQITPALMTPVLFDPLSAPGFVHLGPVDRLHYHADPGLAGLKDAHQILLLGPLAGATLRATDFVGNGGRQPGGALRARLRDAAAWLEGRCAEAAAALRAPHLRVGDDGSIDCAPPTAPQVLLRLPA
jgi:hypothetical protein